MPLPPLVSIEELAMLLGEPVDDSSAGRLDRAVNLASREVRAWCRQRLDRVTADTVTLDGNGAHSVWLPQTPVTAVTTVLLDGTALVADSDYTWERNGTLHRGRPDLPGFGVEFGYDHGWGVTRSPWRNRGWGWKPRSIVVTYDHGLPDDELDEVRAVVIRLATEFAGNPAGIAGERDGSYMVTFGRAGSAPSLSELDMATLGRFRRVNL